MWETGEGEEETVCIGSVWFFPPRWPKRTQQLLQVRAFVEKHAEKGGFHTLGQRLTEKALGLLLLSHPRVGQTHQEIYGEQATAAPTLLRNPMPGVEHLQSLISLVLRNEQSSTNQGRLFLVEERKLLIPGTMGIKPALRCGKIVLGIVELGQTGGDFPGQERGPLL